MAAANRPSYTDQEKMDALLIYAEDGLAVASKATGISASTISAWAREQGIQRKGAEDDGRANAEKRLRWEERRLKLAHDIGAQAEKALARTAHEIAAGKTTDAKNMALTTAVLIDKAQLLTGAMTSGKVGVPVKDDIEKREKELDELANKRKRKAS